MRADEVMQRVEEFRVAYNDVDISKLESLVATNIHWEHHNKFGGDGRDGLMRSIKEFAEKTPGRFFDKPTRFAINDLTVFIEHAWHATPAHSDPAWGWKEGVPFSMDTCSVFVFDGGLITEWSDYG